jgi:hypothetical protein
MKANVTTVNFINCECEIDLHLCFKPFKSQPVNTLPYLLNLCLLGTLTLQQCKHRPTNCHTQYNVMLKLLTVNHS